MIAKIGETSSTLVREHAPQYPPLQWTTGHALSNVQ